MIICRNAVFAMFDLWLLLLRLFCIPTLLSTEAQAFKNNYSSEVDAALYWSF